MKAETNNIHTIFLLKKNVRSDMIKTILGYLPIVAPESLKKQKVAIISVKQEYKSIEVRQDYRIELEITYGGRKVPMDIEKSKDNYNKDRKLKCFNCNIYRHITKNCQKPKKEKKTRKCYKYDKVEYLTKNYGSEQKIKN